jgi:hypothetical protein
LSAANEPYNSVGAYVKLRRISGKFLVASVGRGAMSFGPVPRLLALATYSVRPADASAMGINSVGTNPIGSTMPFPGDWPSSRRGSRTATASDPKFAAYNREPSSFNARALGSAPK